MRRPDLSALVVLLTVGPLLAQKPISPPPQRPIPEPATRQKPTQHTVVVRGCVENARLKIALSGAPGIPFDTLNASEFILEGPKEMLRQLQEEHQGHYDEIAGVAIVPPPPNDSDTAVETVKKGPVRITAGTRHDKGPVTDSAPRQIRLRVASLTHVREGCVARR
jgi:hypothetical protein